MSGNPPARAWYRRVTETIAMKGWSKAELSERSGVARSTIDGWEKNPRPPQSKSVNAVADALGIPRDRALRLAGIIGSEPEPSPPEPWPPPDAPADLVRVIWSQVPDEEGRRRVLEAALREIRGEPEPPANGPGAATPPGGSRRRAG